MPVDLPSGSYDVMNGGIEQPLDSAGMHVKHRERTNHVTRTLIHTT